MLLQAPLLHLLFLLLTLSGCQLEVTEPPPTELQAGRAETQQQPEDVCLPGWILGDPSEQNLLHSSQSEIRTRIFHNLHSRSTLGFQMYLSTEPEDGDTWRHQEDLNQLRFNKELLRNFFFIGLIPCPKPGGYHDNQRADRRRKGQRSSQNLLLFPHPNPNPPRSDPTAELEWMDKHYYGVSNSGFR